jgi:hypothetical protein
MKVWAKYLEMIAALNPRTHARTVRAATSRSKLRGAFVERARAAVKPVSNYNECKHCWACMTHMPADRSVLSPARVRINLRRVGRCHAGALRCRRNGG